MSSSYNLSDIGQAHCDVKLIENCLENKIV